jgi:hypothetical protein
MVFNTEFPDDNHRVPVMNLKYTLIRYFCAVSTVCALVFISHQISSALCHTEFVFSLKINKTEFFCVYFCL